MVHKFGHYTHRTYNINLGYSRPRYNVWNSMAMGALTGLALGTTAALTSRLCGGYYGGFGGLGCFGGLSGFGYYGGTGLLADCLITPTNFSSSLYCDLDSPRGVASVSPMVNAAINNPFSFQGMLGSYMIGGYI